MNVALQGFAPDAVWKLITSVAAGMLGGLIVRWWDRARALVLLKGFLNILGRDDVPCSAALIELSARSWATKELAPIEPVQQVYDAHFAARNECRRCEEGAERLPALRAQLAAANTPGDAIAVLDEIFKRPELTNGIVEGVQRSVIHTPAGLDRDQQSVEVRFEDQHENGRFIMLFRGSWGESIGKDLNDQPVLRSALDSWLNAVRTIDKETLLASLDRLPPLLAEEAAINERIVEITWPILQEHSRWMVKIVVSNYGSKDMVVWPDATLVISSGGERIAIPCLLESVEEPRLRYLHEIVGVHLVPAGEQITMWAGTIPQQRQIRRGQRLRSHFEAGNAQARLVLRITRRRSFRGFGTRSDAAPFRDGIEGFWPSSTHWNDLYRE